MADKAAPHAIRLDAVDRQRWEYKAIPLSPDFSELLDRAGRTGWELVAVDSHIAYLKRQRR